MSTDPIKIPQNVYIEDRIIGPLTLKQVIISAIGCGFSYAIYATLAKSYGALSLPITIMVWIPGAISLVFAFLKINDLSMLQICLLMLERVNKPGIRSWAPRRGISINIRTQAPKKSEKEEPAQHATTSSNHLDELSAILDRTATQESAKVIEERIEAAPATEPDTVVQPTEKEVPQHDEPLIDEPGEEDLHFPPRPVDPSRIGVSPLKRNTDTIATSIPRNAAS